MHSGLDDPDFARLSTPDCLDLAFGDMPFAQNLRALKDAPACFAQLWVDEFGSDLGFVYAI
jgi:hypothetical protein